RERHADDGPADGGRPCLFRQRDRCRTGLARRGCPMALPVAPSPAGVPLHLVLPPGRTGETTHPLVRRLAAGYVVLQKSGAIVRLWPTPQALLDDKSAIGQVMVDHFQEAATAAGSLARAAVHNAMQEAMEFLEGPDTRTAAGYADAILQRLEWARGPRT